MSGPAEAPCPQGNVAPACVHDGLAVYDLGAMWKARPAVASRVGGIQDQIAHDRSGLLQEDPSDLAAFGRSTATLLEDHERAARLGREAHRRVARTTSHLAG